MLQNATPLRKSAPWPPNSSDENVSCTAPTTENASLQILFKCPTPAIVFWKCRKTLTFCSLLTRSTIPCACHAKAHLNVQKWSEHGVFCTFWLPSRHNGAHFFHISTSKSGLSMMCFVHFDFDMCFAATACTFSTSQLPKVVRRWCVLYILTWKCASRHNGVHFLSLIWPAGSAPAALGSLLFDPPEPQIIGKTLCFATFLLFRAPGSSFFWDFLFFDLLS